MTLEHLVSCRKTPIQFTNSQYNALNKIVTFLNSSDSFFLLSGYSGCGKTTLAENIANATSAILLAPTNAAVNRLVEKIDNSDLTYKTIHSALYSAADNTFYVDKKLEIGKTYIIDECSMVDAEILHEITKQAKQKKCKVIFIGDSFQLEPIGEDPEIFSWENSSSDFLAHNKYELTEVKRYDGTLLEIATQLRNVKKAEFKQPDNSDLTFVKKFTKQLAIDIKKNNNYVVITSTNERRVMYNEKIRSYKFQDPELDDFLRKTDVLVSVSNNDKYSNGELFLAKDPQFLQKFQISYRSKQNKLNILNAYHYIDNDVDLIFIPQLNAPSLTSNQLAYSVKTNDTILPTAIYNKFITTRRIRGGQMQYFFSKKAIICTFGYAISCHKAQGQEWDNVYIDAHWLMPAWNAAKWFYTAITRAKNKVEIIENKYLKTI